MIQSIAFYLFSIVLIASAMMVVVARNPVHSVLFLILAFFNSAALFILNGAEFLAMILVVVYVGAVAVLFLFVVMMLDVNFARLREGFLRYLPIGGMVGLVFLFELVLVSFAWVDAAPKLSIHHVPIDVHSSNTRALGNVIYTRYALVFQASGLVLLVAMIGAIVLTLRDRSGVRRQDIGRQLARGRDTGVKVVKVEPRTGV